VCFIIVLVFETATAAGTDAFTDKMIAYGEGDPIIRIIIIIRGMVSPTRKSPAGESPATAAVAADDYGNSSEVVAAA
jgi:hypothetical protein